MMFFYANPRAEMRSRPRCWEHYLPSNSRPRDLTQFEENTMTTMTKTVGPVIKTKLPGPNAARILKEDARAISPSYTRSYPLVAKRGHGAMIEDVDGNEF